MQEGKERATDLMQWNFVWYVILNDLGIPIRDDDGIC